MNDKMIEEMASDMNFACIELSKEQRLEIARVLTNLDYLKIPEGSVVLSKEQNAKWSELFDQARKETAKKYFNAVIEMLKEVKQFETIDIKDLVFLHEKNKEYAKQFGVEVEE